MLFRVRERKVGGKWRERGGREGQGGGEKEKEGAAARKSQQVNERGEK